MSKKSRYLLILVGFIIFIILAPIIVLYVNGFKYNTLSKNFVRTGILAVRTQPSSVDITINNKLVKTSSGDIKFLNPGEYNVVISKQGYQSWSKRLAIVANRVTWANPVPNNLTLFKQYIQPENLSDSNISDFTISSGNILYLSQQSSTSSNLNMVSELDYNNPQSYALPEIVTKISNSPRSNLYLLTNDSKNIALVFNIRDRKIKNLADFLPKKPFKATLSPDGTIYILQENILYKFDQNTLALNKLTQNVVSFASLDGDIYYLNNTSTTTNLSLLTDGNKSSQLLLTNILKSNQSQIFVTLQKQVFVLLGSDLYKVSSSLQLIAKNVTATNFDQSQSNLLVLHDGQLDYYDFNSQTLNFITRSSKVLNNFVFRPDLGYALFFADNSVVALELDTRDHQNQYTFYTAQNPQKFMVDTNTKNLFILDGNKLLIQNIR